MSVNTETSLVQGQTTVLNKEGVYASLFEKINLSPASSLGDINAFLDDTVLSDATAGERLTAAMQVFMDCIRQSGKQVEKLDKTLIDHHIAELDYQISRQLDVVMHHQEFQKVESLWRGLKQLVDNTDYRQNVKTEILDVSKDDLRQDFEDAPELIQSGLYWHTYTAEYDTPGGEPIGSVISAYEFDASPQDMTLLRNISKVSAAAHMPFIGAVGPAFFMKDTMEEVAAIKDIGNYFDRAEYIKWKSFRETDDARYIGLVMPRVLGRLPYGPDTVPVRSFNYVEQVKGPDHEKYLWTSASFAFASNMVRSFIQNGWCVQIRGPQAGGAVKDLPIHLYDLGTGNQVKIPSEVMIPETREFEFANLGFIPLSYYKNRDYACFFSANSTQKPALYDTADATANSRINARLPYIFLLSRIAHYLKLIQRENIGISASRKIFTEGSTMKMATIAGKYSAALLAMIFSTALAGCGLTQSVKDGAVSVTRSIFYKQVKTLHLDIRAREGVNNNAQGASLATVVRIYQLKDRKVFDDTDYPSLFAEDSQAIQGDWLAEKDIRLRPGESVAVDMPLEAATQYVAIAGMFMAPDLAGNSWRLVLTRDDLDADKPRVIEAGHNRLTLQPLKDN